MVKNPDAGFWVSVTQAFCWVAVKLLAEVKSPQDTTGAEGSVFNCPIRLLAVIRRSTSKLTRVDLYTGLPRDMTAGFPRTSNQRD